MNGQNNQNQHNNQNQMDHNSPNMNPNDSNMDHNNPYANPNDPENPVNPDNPVNSYRPHQQEQPLPNAHAGRTRGALATAFRFPNKYSRYSVFRDKLQEKKPFVQQFSQIKKR